MTNQPVPVVQVRIQGESSRPGFVTVGINSVLVLRPNSLRKEATFTNDSLNVIFLAKGDLATLNAGIRLNALGGVAIIEPDSTGRIYTGPMAAITSVATQNLCFTEDL